jgi:hypothetical protein
MALEKTEGFVPVPDPTKLTTDAVNAAKADIEKLFDNKLHALSTELDDFKTLVKEMVSGRDTALAAALKAADDQSKLQNSSNAIATEKSEKATTKQIDALGERLDDLKERLGALDKKDWSSVGGYIMGAFGIAALVLAALEYHK